MIKIIFKLQFILYLSLGVFTESFAQEYLEKVIERINNIEKDLKDIQRITYDDKIVKSSDKLPNPEKTNANQNSIVSDHESRLLEIEEEMRNITGLVEEMNYKLSIINETITSLELNNFEQQKSNIDNTNLIAKNSLESEKSNYPENELVVITEEESTIKKLEKPIKLDEATIQNPNDPSLQEIDEPTLQELDENIIIKKIIDEDPNLIENDSMKVLGTIKKNTELKNEEHVIKESTSNTLTSEVQKSISRNKNSSPITSKTEYQLAYDKLARAEYDEAEIAFKSFIGEHPKNPLSSNAYYWLGETYYARKKYQLAAISFAKGYQSFPEGNKAADQLLKLAMTFVNLGKNDDACAAFSRLEAEFPNAPKRIINRSKEYSQRAECM